MLLSYVYFFFGQKRASYIYIYIYIYILQGQIIHTHTKEVKSPEEEKIKQLNEHF